MICIHVISSVCPYYLSITILLSTSTTASEATTITDTVTTITTTVNTITIPAPTGQECSTILAKNTSASSGEYDIILLEGGKSVRVYCDMETDGGGWTVFQRRVDGTWSFYRNYAQYAEGFGNLSHEFWLGNDNIHLLTAVGDHELRVDLEHWNGYAKLSYANYDSFAVGPASDGYRLHVSGYNGTAGDSLKYHDNQMFTTYDNDQDDYDGNCAVRNEAPGGMMTVLILT